MEKLVDGVKARDLNAVEEGFVINALKSQKLYDKIHKKLSLLRVKQTLIPGNLLGVWHENSQETNDAM